MTGGPDLIHDGKQAVPVAVDPQIDQFLRMPAGFALDPELLPGPGPVSDPACLQRAQDRIAIHPGQHENVAVHRILRHHRQQTVSIVAQRFGVEFHGFSFCIRRDAAYVERTQREGKPRMADSDLIKLYSKRILALAADIPHLGRLDAPMATARRRSPLCGSVVTVDLDIADGRIVRFAQDVKACALGQAAASVVGRNAIGLDRAAVGRARDQLEAMLKSNGAVPDAPFDELEVLQPAADFKNRHASILLSLDATLEAFDAASASACA